MLSLDENTVLTSFVLVSCVCYAISKFLHCSVCSGFNESKSFAGRHWSFYKKWSPHLVRLNFCHLFCSHFHANERFTKILFIPPRKWTSRPSSVHSSMQMNVFTKIRFILPHKWTSRHSSVHSSMQMNLTATILFILPGKLTSHHNSVHFPGKWTSHDNSVHSSR